MIPPVITVAGAPKTATYVVEMVNNRLPNAVTRVIRVVTTAVSVSSTTLGDV